ncbi:MAG: hypothetical protein P0Y64_17970 [Candidatus Sphingomonas colombiensis]|nr:hypothetical protein [Sphingomonas sp.]WEK43186.1 MAG: hypothetical protein P0Y64_17970 [Sphingomonas sp.]
MIVEGQNWNPIHIAPLLAMFVVGCNSAPSEVKTLRYDRDIVIVTSISGPGGALGDESYQVSYRYNGNETKFFEGVNPHGFDVCKIGDRVKVKFCDGTVRLAQPIFIGTPRSELVHVKPNLDCPERQTKI